MHADTVTEHADARRHEASSGDDIDRSFRLWLKEVQRLTGQEFESGFGSLADALFGDGTTPEEAADELMAW